MSKIENLVPGQFYHIYNRGNNKEAIFYEKSNYHYFLNLYNEHIPSIAETYSYCLLKNHFHFILKINGENELPEKYRFENRKLSIPFSNFFNSYSKSINKRYGRTGSLFQERFKRKVIISENSLMELIYHIHFDPQKHGMIKDYRNYYFSSYKSILSNKKTHLAREKVLALFGSKRSFIEFHKEMQIKLSDNLHNTKYHCN